MLNFNQTEYKEMLEKAEQAEACSPELAVLKNLTVEQAFENEQLPFWLYWYASYVIEDRWPEAEPFIVRDAERAYWYAKHVIEGRWPEAEQAIKKRTYFWDLYCEHFNLSDEQNV